MAKVALQRKVASNPKRNPKRKTKGNSSMTAAQKKAFVARMARARKTGSKKKSKNPAWKPKRKSTSAKSKRRNPSCKRRNPSRRNPTLLTDPKSMAINIVTALLSAVATRQLPQLALSANNTGWKGYLANVAAAAASTFAAHEFLGAPAGQAAMIGGGVIILDRVLTEQFSPVGQYLSLTGLGDATAATSLGTVSDGYYIHPTIFDSNGNPIIPHAITDAAVKAFQNLAPAPAAATGRRAIAAPLSGVGTNSRFASRF